MKKRIQKKKPCKPTIKEIPQSDTSSTLLDSKTMTAVVVLPDGLKHEGEKRFHFDDNSELVYFRGYVLPDTKLQTLQQAVSPVPDKTGYIEYVTKVCPALKKAGFKCMACNEEGLMTCANFFNTDAWAFTGAQVRLFGPVVLMKRME